MTGENNGNLTAFRELYRIVDDLWAHEYGQETPAKGTFTLPTVPEVKPLPPDIPLEIPEVFRAETPDAAPAQAEETAAEEPVTEAPAEEAPAAPAVPPVERLWVVCDDQIDWTAALAGNRPESGITVEEWDFCREKAERVLNGDIGAYTEVLNHLKPVEDLRPYCAALDLTVEDADQLTAVLAMKPEYLGEDEEARKRALCGLALRAARDLFAALPVSRVCVKATGAGLSVGVTYERAALHRARFAFLDPVAFAGENGAVFA